MGECAAAAAAALYRLRLTHDCSSYCSNLVAVAGTVAVRRYTDEDQLPLKPTWMMPYQEQALEAFVAAGGSFMPLHNSMWGYPIGIHLDGGKSPDLTRPSYKQASKLGWLTAQPPARCTYGTGDPGKWDRMGEELTDVQAKLVASTQPTTTEEVGLGDESKMGPYRRVCGGVGGHHPAFELQEVIVVDDSHPVTKGVTSFAVHDEQHFTFIDEHRGAQLLLINRGSNGAESCAGWAYEHGAGQGRVVYLASGHVPLVNHTSMDLPEDAHDAMSHPMVQKLLHNAVAWMAHVEPPPPSASL